MIIGMSDIVARLTTLDYAIVVAYLVILMVDRLPRQFWQKEKIGRE
jgi:hypothetical protein